MKSLAFPNIDPPPTPQRVQFSVLTLAVIRFSLIFRCTHRAHAAFQLIEKPKLSLQSIIGATESFHLKSFISFIYLASYRSYKGLDRGNTARTGLDIFCFFPELYFLLESQNAKSAFLSARMVHTKVLLHTRGDGLTDTPTWGGCVGAFTASASASSATVSLSFGCAIQKPAIFRRTPGRLSAMRPQPSAIPVTAPSKAQARSAFPRPCRAPTRNAFTTCQDFQSISQRPIRRAPAKDSLHRS